MVNCGTLRQYLNFVWTDFLYPSCFGITTFKVRLLRGVYRQSRMDLIFLCCSWLSDLVIIESNEVSNWEVSYWNQV